MYTASGISAVEAQRLQTHLQTHSQTQPLSGAVEPTTEHPSLVFTGVTVVDVTNGHLLRGQTVVISGNRVRSIGPMGKPPVPAGARVVDATGKYMIPGLWDMHAHVDDLADKLYPRYIAHGITGLREMAQRFPFGTDSFRVWQQEVMDGKRVGPRVYGPSVDYPYHFQESRTTEDVLRTMDSLKAQGMLFLKYHDDFGDRQRFFAMAREAKRIGLPMVGHLPVSVTDVEASDSGIGSVEHVQENHQCWPNWAAPLGDSATTDKRCAPVARAYVRNGTWMDPTLTTAWPDPIPHRQSAALFKDALRLVRMMHRLGVTKFLAGTDWAPDYQASWEPQFFPGLSSAEEIVFFGDAGLTPLQALQTGTLNPALFIHGTDSLGTVAVGKLADLVLLDGNPLADISNVLKVRAVVANGRYFDRATLDSLDPEGTKPGVGLVPLQRRFEQTYSRNFVVGPDTTEVELTDDLLMRYIALWKDLKGFWQQHPELWDSAHVYADYPVIPVSPDDKPDRGENQQIRVFDYAFLATKNPVLAALFKKNNVPPEQFLLLQITMKKAQLREARKSEQASDGNASNPAALNAMGKFAAKNLAIAEAHKADLNAAGITF